jgi:hypothetical protein
MKRFLPSEENENCSEHFKLNFQKLRLEDQPELKSFLKNELKEIDQEIFAENKQVLKEEKEKQHKEKSYKIEKAVRVAETEGTLEAALKAGVTQRTIQRWVSKSEINPKENGQNNINENFQKLKKTRQSSNPEMEVSPNVFLMI